MGDVEDIIKSPEKHGIAVYHFMGEDTEKLFIKLPLPYPEMIIKPCLRSPADMECRMDMAF